MVLNSLREDVVDGDVHLLNQCVDTDHKFKWDKSDDDECVHSQPDPGQTLSRLFLFFSGEKSEVCFSIPTLPMRKIRFRHETFCSEYYIRVQVKFL